MDSPVTLSPSGYTLKNAVVKAAMDEMMADASGAPTENFLKLYKHWDNVDNFITGHMMVSSDAVAFPGTTIITDTDEFKAGMRKVREILANSTLIAQINHPGRQISPDMMQSGKMRPVSPFEGPCLPGFPVPELLTDERLAEILEYFIKGSEILFECGFDGISLHAAHGYLLSEVLHPKVMTDKRLDMVVEMAATLRQKYPNKIISAKLNLGDHYELDHFKKIVTRLDPILDFVEISGGSYADPKMTSPSPRHALFARVVEEGFNTKKIMLTGGFRTKEDFDKALSVATLVGVARPYAYENDVFGAVAEGKTLKSSRSLPLIFLMILTIWSYFTGKNFWTTINPTAVYVEEFYNITNGVEKRDKIPFGKAYKLTKDIIFPKKQ